VVVVDVEPVLAAGQCLRIRRADRLAGIGVQAMAGPVAQAGAAAGLGAAVGVQQAAQRAGGGATEQQAQQAGVFG